MISVGLYPGDADCAAAVAIDGRLAAAIDVPRNHGESGVETCRALIRELLAVARISGAAVEQLAVVNLGDLARRIVDAPEEIWDGQPPPAQLLCPRRAAAAQLHGHAGTGAVIAQNDSSDTAMLFTSRDARLDAGEPLAGSDDAIAAAALVARALGAIGEPPLLALERIATSRPRASVALVNEPGPRVPINPREARELVDGVLASCPQLADGGSRHVAVQATRASLAAGTLDAVADTLVASICAATPVSSFHGLAGTAFAPGVFVDRIAQRLSSPFVAPILEDVGGALGAALLPHATAAPLEHVALGPDVDETEIKATLENCRLDFVYEPDWTKLLTRVSSLLSTGALIGWCQGRRDFGSRTFGSRSVLADPSRRYVRENVNVFLRRGELHAAVPVSMLADTWQAGYESAGGDLGRYFGGVADQLGRVLVHRQTPAVAPHLAQLLQVHAASTGIPGLVNVPLADRHGRLVRTTRDAVREAFSSAVDVLVIGRFLVSKDYWLIRAR
jgi:hypothetical protein